MQIGDTQGLDNRRYGGWLAIVKNQHGDVRHWVSDSTLRLSILTLLCRRQKRHVYVETRRGSPATFAHSAEDRSMNTDGEFEIKCDLNDLSLAPYAPSSIPHLTCIAVTTVEASLFGPSLALEAATSLRTLS